MDKHDSESTPQQSARELLFEEPISSDDGAMERPEPKRELLFEEPISSDDGAMERPEPKRFGQRTGRLALPSLAFLDPSLARRRHPPARIASLSPERYRRHRIEDLLEEGGSGSDLKSVIRSVIILESICLSLASINILYFSIFWEVFAAYANLIVILFTTEWERTMFLSTWLFGSYCLMAVFVQWAGLAIFIVMTSGVVVQEPSGHDVLIGVVTFPDRSVAIGFAATAAVLQTIALPKSLSALRRLQGLQALKKKADEARKKKVQQEVDVQFHLLMSNSVEDNQPHSMSLTSRILKRSLTLTRIRSTKPIRNPVTHELDVILESYDDSFVPSPTPSTLIPALSSLRASHTVVETSHSD